jgi:hypothetical protein
MAGRCSSTVSRKRLDCSRSASFAFFSVMSLMIAPMPPVPAVAALPGGEREFDRETLAVAAHRGHFHRGLADQPGLGAGNETREPRGVGRPELGRHDQFERRIDRLGCRIAEDAFGGRVPLRDEAGPISRHDRVGRGPHQCVGHRPDFAEAAQLELDGGELRKAGERGALFGRERHPRLEVYQAQCADAVTGAERERRAGVIADVRIAHDQHVAGKTRVGGCVRDLEHAFLLDGVTAKGDAAIGFADIETVARLEPLRLASTKDSKATGTLKSWAASLVIRSNSASGGLSSTSSAPSAANRSASPPITASCRRRSPQVEVARTHGACPRQRLILHARETVLEVLPSGGIGIHMDQHGPKSGIAGSILHERRST